MISGHITICKIYKDGTKEVVLDNHNIVAAGLGSSFIDIIQNNGSVWAEDYRPKYFQVGTSSMDYDDTLSTSSYFYQLSTPLLWEDYGEDTDLTVEHRDRGFNASTEDGTTFQELLFTSAHLSAVQFSSVENSSSWFPLIPDSNITKWYLDACETEIILDERSANGKTISEIGMFARNPKGLPNDTPLLIVYRSFTGIPKTSDYSLVFHWSIGFLGGTTIDRTFYGKADTTKTLLNSGYRTWGKKGQGAGPGGRGGKY
mgnify:CR=1 FL=1|tara:strand:+ start:57 stop:830 length:774 start_codon:yes stop_codon:yes gene_type:complete